MPVILDTWEAEIRKIVVLDQTGKKCTKIPSQQFAGQGRMYLSSQIRWEA
jgi:hypothetical protein